MIELILVATSALLLQCALMWPTYCFWMVFIFLIPLLYRVVCLPLSHPYKEGVLWGMLFFAFHFYALFLVFHEKADGSFKLFAPVIFTLYCAGHAALWLGITARLARGKSAQNQVALWGAGSWVYFYWICYCLLWPCGKWVGYCFGSPLLPLTQYPQFLLTIGAIGVKVSLACLMGMQTFGVMYYLVRAKCFAIISCACALPFCLGWVGSFGAQSPEYLASLCYAVPPARSLKCPLEQAEEINMSILKCQERKPDAVCILMPESSFTHSLNEHDNAIQLWGVNCLANGNTLCIGSYRTDTEQNEFNTLFIIRNCRIIKSYDKCNLMPFVEYLPSFLKKFIWIKNLFLKKNNEFSPNKTCLRSITLTNKLQAIPFICSDLYMADEELVRGDEKMPILLCVNDSWFSALYARRLMLLYAIYYSLAYKRDILYIGHSFGCWISHTTGKTILL